MEINKMIFSTLLNPKARYSSLLVSIEECVKPLIGIASVQFRFDSSKLTITPHLILYTYVHFRSANGWRSIELTTGNNHIRKSLIERKQRGITWGS